MTTQTDNVATTSTQTVRFLSAGGFHYDITCSPVPALPDQFNIRVTTQWDEARRPDDKQVALNITLSRDQLQTLVITLKDALAMHPTDTYCSP